MREGAAPVGAGDFYRAIAEAVPHLVWTCLPDGRCDYLGPQWVAYTGIPEAPQLGYKWTEQLHPDDRDATAEAWNRAALSEIVFDTQFRIRRHDGVYRWFRTRAVPQWDTSGRLVRWYGTNTDTQQEREAEETLRSLAHDLDARVEARTEQLRVLNLELGRMSRRLSLATSGAGCGIWEWNLQTNALHWDEQMFRLYRQNLEHFAGAYEAWQAALHPADRERAEREIGAAATGTGVFDTTFRVCWPDGTVRFIRAHAVVDHDEQGRPLSMLGTNWDVTKEAEAERALEARTTLLHEFVAHAPAAIAMLDRNMCYLQASERWFTDYKLVGQQLVGRCHYDVFPDVPDRWKQVHQSVLAGAIESCEEDPFPRQDGSVDWLQWEVRPWHTEAGEIGGVIFFTQVITARKRMELMLLSQKAELERSNGELEQFAYVASHDLQEPLRAIGGCAQILAAAYKGKLDPSADELIGHITDGVDRMNTLIRDLLALSRVTVHAAKPELVDTAVAFAAATANLTAAIRESGAVLHVGPLPQVLGDQRQLTQLFQNLLGNALKYSGNRQPELHIACEQRMTECEFSIRDNGIGIEPQYFERIFGIFQRLHTRKDYPGTGIGLAICQKIVQRHGGRIWVESTPSHGSIFRFILPRGSRTLVGGAP
ncbi:MAG: hypothetical protein RLZZ450_3865 [Pseudomonadota bacterium]